MTFAFLVKAREIPMMTMPERLFAREASITGEGVDPVHQWRVRVARATWIFLFAGAFVFVSAWSWRKWPDVLVDYGTQLYIPWQLSTGKALYRDLAYLTGGPLSQYFHALLFKLFGVSLTTLILSNLCLMGIFFLMLFRLFERAADTFTAALICTVVLFVFAFSQESSYANYNYICPYSYETVHGLYLSVAAIACLWRWISSGRQMWAWSAGLCYGCVFLTKPDLFLAMTITMLVAVFVKFMKRADRSATAWAGLVMIAMGFLAPVVVIVAYYGVVRNMGEGFKAAAGAWLPLLTTRVAYNDFYRWCMGFDKPGFFARRMVEYSGVVLLMSGYFAVCSRCLRRGNSLGFVMLIPMVYMMYRAFEWPGWRLCGLALLPLTGASCLFIAWSWWRRRDSAEAAKLIFPLLWSVFALFLLAKMGFFTRIWHYGFYLAMPAAALVIFMIAWLVPRELARYQVNRHIYRLFIVCFLGIGVARLVMVSESFYRGKILAVGTGGDVIYTAALTENPADDGVKQTVEWLDQSTRATDTVAVMPEGVMINYLSRRANSTAYTVFLPTDLQAFGETNMLAAYEKSPPDYIVLVQRDTTEFGVKDFGQERGYGYDIMKWVRANYSPQWLYGNEPLVTNKFGILMMKRNGGQMPVHAD